MGKRQSQAWKALERAVAKELGGTRVLRGADFSVEDVDVKIADFPHLKVDCKYRTRHAHHSLLAEIREKYCEENEVPILVTKHHNQDGACVTVTLDFFKTLLEAARMLDRKLAAEAEKMQ